MRHIAVVLLALALASPISAGPVIIGGEDLDWHGNYNNGAGPTQKGWRYIENAIREMRKPGCITRGDGSIVVLGAPSAPTLHNGTANWGGHGGAAIHYAANIAQGPITIYYFDGATAITNYFSSTSYNPSIIYIPSSFAASGMTAAEQAVLNANANALKNFVNGGGGLMAHVDPNSAWLSTVLGSGFSFGGAWCNSTGATLTAAGSTAFPTLSNNDINASAGPCHATFATFGTLQPLAIDGAGNVFIIGGGCNTTIGPAFSCTTPVCPGQATTCTSTNATGPFTWNFGDGTPLVTTQNATHSYANPGTYTVTFTSSGGTSTVTHNVVVAPQPPLPAISGSTSACGSQTYCVAGVPGVTYNWTITGGTPTTGTGNCITVAWSGTGPHVVQVDAVNAWGCRRRSVLPLKPCASVTCCEPNALQATLTNFTAVGGGKYDLTTQITAPPGWLINRVRAELANTVVMYSPPSCGTSGPANSYVTAVAPNPGLPLTSMPFTFGREAVWEIAVPSGVVSPVALTFTAQFPPMPSSWFCTDFLSFCVRYEVTMLVPTPTGKICRTCSISRCYGPYRRSKWDPTEVGEVVVGRPFSLTVRPQREREDVRLAAPSGRLTLTIKRGTGDSSAQLGGGNVVAIRNGAAEFRDLVIDRPGRGYVLVITAEDGTELAETKPFSVKGRE